jgi:hypothetical protein
MARGTRKQDKRRVKRQEKRRSARAAQSSSPYRRIGTHGETKACYLSRDWKNHGMGSLLCLRKAPGGGHALAAFLIDFWCLGLKDAWGRVDISMEEFRQATTRFQDVGDHLVRIDLDLARRLVAGSIRFARQNGFRLPPRYERWVALMGGIDDAATADLSSFGVDGGLRYIGSMDDLRKRLLHGTVDEFFERKDVHYVIGGEESLLLDGGTIELEDMVGSANENFMDAFRPWCFANGVSPHPRIGEALELMMEAVMQTPLAGEDDASMDEVADDVGGNIARFLALCEPADDVELDAAMKQLGEFAASFDSPEEMMRHCGLTDLDDEGDDENLDNAQRF